MLRHLVLIAVLFTTCAASALEESSLPESFTTLALPYFNSVPVQEFKGQGGVTLRYRHFPSSGNKGTLVIVSGFTEFMRKWAELVYDIKDSGYSIFIYDHRGQGESEHLVADDSKKGHVEDFQNWVDDLNTFMTTVVKPASKGSIFMLAHSMGGGIATAYNIQNPGVVKAFVASSPMMGPRLKIFSKDLDVPFEGEVSVRITLSQRIGLKATSTLIALGQSTHYAPGRGPDDWIEDPANNVLSTSVARTTYVQALKQEHPEEIISGPTVQWVHEALRLGFFVRENAEHLRTPTLIYRASGEQVVESKFDDMFVTAAGAQIKEFDGAEHEIFVEQDKYRKPAIEAMLEFFSSTASKAAANVR